ncbi:hypothetical protein [Brumicola nitratireducens]|uniref:Uncharacterized protein n=1 Tax=Glaciecola nitratireducens (strain JCM 12485 / KCTC 12276 / FR1064) TaxID=1085623 RepID=G4QJM7_GLANF|nr:hypothetical protein [Glaciecola nitratireducens]AEP28687.1 hypothetical protein GNIT_0533 [Glaciecola nitratireducens FR1064]
MLESQKSPLLTEWVTLQNQCDAFEKLSLGIKLLAVLLASLFSITLIHPEIILVLNSILWVQDAVWKTFQSRFSERLLQIESSLSSSQSDSSIQFNTAWEAKPRGIVFLVSEYLRHLAKPTVVFPHLVLILLGAYVVILL